MTIPPRIYLFKDGAVGGLIVNTELDEFACELPARSQADDRNARCTPKLGRGRICTHITVRKVVGFELTLLRIARTKCKRSEPSKERAHPVY